MKLQKTEFYEIIAMDILQQRNYVSKSLYIKKIESVDKSKQNGYCFVGQFLIVAKNCLTENELDTDALYIIGAKYDSKDGIRPVACLATFGGKYFSAVSNIETGWDYALKLRSKAESLLVVKSKFDPQKFVSQFKQHEVIMLKNYLMANAFV